MNTHWKLSNVVCIVFLVIIILFCSAKANAQWLTQFNQAQETAIALGKPIFLYFRNPDSPACLNFESEILAKPAIQRDLGSFILVQINPGWDEALAAQYGIYRVPAVVISDATGNPFYKSQRNLTLEILQKSLGEIKEQYLRSPPNPPTLPSGNIPVSVQNPVVGIEPVPIQSATPDEPIPVLARVQKDITEIRIYYRFQGQKSYIAKPMEKVEDQEDLWQGDIPYPPAVSGGIEYYITGKDKTRSVVIVPKEYAIQPYRFEVRP